MALNIADLFEHAVDAAPGRPALKIDERTVSYADLEAEANRLAHFLAARGIGPGDHVGVYAKNSIEHVVAVLAIFKIRAVAINVNYRYVEAELDYLFDNADLVALLHERPYAPLVAACARKHARLRTVVAMPDPSSSRSVAARAASTSSTAAGQPPPPPTRRYSGTATTNPSADSALASGRTGRRSYSCFQNPPCTRKTSGRGRDGPGGRCTSRTPSACAAYRSTASGGSEWRVSTSSGSTGPR